MLETIDSETEKKIKRAVQRLKEQYAKELESRKCTLFLKDTPSEQKITKTTYDKKGDIVSQMESLIISNSPIPSPKANIIKKPSTDTIVYCKATKMDGNKCNYKACAGLEFCGRHKKK